MKQTKINAGQIFMTKTAEKNRISNNFFVNGLRVKDWFQIYLGNMRGIFRYSLLFVKKFILDVWQSSESGYEHIFAIYNNHKFVGNKLISPFESQFNRFSKVTTLHLKQLCPAHYI